MWGAWAAILLASWLRATARALGTLAFVQVPSAWLVANALRHVDTPHTPYRLGLGLGLGVRVGVVVRVRVRARARVS